MLGGMLQAFMFASEASREQRRTVDLKLKAMREARLRQAQGSSQHKRELEDDLGRVALLARSLAEVCIKKGVLTREELGQMLVEIDMADGIRDGKLDARAALPGQQKQADLQPLTPSPQPDQDHSSTSVANWSCR